MPFALVGAANGTSVVSAGTDATFTWQSDQPRTAGHLLIVLTVTEGAAQIPTSTPGWTLVSSRIGATNAVGVWFKVATGGDAAPTFFTIAGAGIRMSPNEFSGPERGQPFDRASNGSSATTPLVVTNSLADVADGDLAVAVYHIQYSVSGTKTFTLTPTPFGSISSFTDQNQAINTGNHFAMQYWWGSTIAGGPDSCSLGVTATNLTEIIGAVASFTLPRVQPVTDYRQPYSMTMVPNKNVGPQVLRMARRFWKTTNWEVLPDPQTTYIPPIQIPNQYVGPMAMRKIYHRRFITRGIDTVAGTFNDFVLTAATLAFTGPTNLTLTVGKVLSGTVSFTGVTDLLKAITKNVAATLSFTGPTNLLKSTTKNLTVGTLSFTGTLIKQTRVNLTAAGLSFTGAIASIRIFLNNLTTAVLSFTGPTNLLKAVNKNLTVGALSFTGPTNLLKTTTKNLTIGVLSFTGSLRKAITTALAAATLSFTGAITKRTGKILSGILSFTGAIASNKAFLWAMAGTLTFTGPTNLLKNITKGLTVAGLSFTGTTIKSTAKQTFTGILSFTGAMVKLPKKALAATLTFTGAHTFNNVFIRALTAATLSFTGAITKKTSKSLVTAVLSFTGPTNLLKSIGKGISGGVSFTGTLLKAIRVSMTAGVLSFTGSITKKTSKFLVTAVLSFTGAFTRAIIFLKVLVTAVLSFTGPTNLLKGVGKNVTGGLSFTGPTNLRLAITKGINGGVSFVGSTIKKTSKFITGTLSFTGGFVAAIPSHFTDFILAAANLTFTGTKRVSVAKNVTGTLGFVGTIRKDITKNLTLAVLSFTGVVLRAFPRFLTATLTFTGAPLVKQTGKRLTGVLSFTGPTNLKKAITKAIQSTLGFFGNLSFPGKFGLAKVGVQLDSIPMVIEMAVAETLPFVVDVSNYLQAGDTIGAIYASLINASTGAPVTVLWRNTITVSGNFMTIPILGSALNLGQTYQMTIVFVASATKYATFITYIKVVA